MLQLPGSFAAYFAIETVVCRAAGAAVVPDAAASGLLWVAAAADGHVVVRKAHVAVCSAISSTEAVAASPAVGPGMTANSSFHGVAFDEMTSSRLCKPSQTETRRFSSWVFNQHESQIRN
jgi:hypothetical protein